MFCVPNLLQGMDPRFIDDVIKIHSDGSITFYQLDMIPGTPQPTAVLTDHNSEQILGDWRPIPSVSCVPQSYNLSCLTGFHSLLSHLAIVPIK